MNIDQNFHNVHSELTELLIPIKSYLIATVIQF